MPHLLLHSVDTTEKISFEGTPLLSDLLFARPDSPEHICGGRGICKKCSVLIKLPGDASPKQVLSCRTRLTGDAEIWLNRKQTDWFIEGAGTDRQPPPQDCAPSGVLTPCIMNRRGNIGVCVDIGSTTLVLQLMDTETCDVLATAASPNPQRKIAADVMGRIQAAMEGKGPLLQQLVSDAVTALLCDACAKAGITEEQVTSKVITGNTTMLMLLTGEDPVSLSKAPFAMSDGFGRNENCGSIGSAYLPGCLHAFVGADTTCAILSCGLLKQKNTCLLCDIGTNGEIVLWKNGKLYVTSTAAGPAFEGAGITCGCGSIRGAIDHVSVENGRLKIHQIETGASNTVPGQTPSPVSRTNTVPAAGLCGSGLIDAVACGLDLELISAAGAMDGEKMILEGDVALYPEDVRTLQLAKAAVQAGIRTLLDISETRYDEIDTLYLAGGFGSHLDPVSAGKIGLIPPELTEKVRAVGNAALEGAGILLCDPSAHETEKQIAALSTHVNLGGNPLFNDYYMESMLFGEEE